VQRNFKGYPVMVLTAKAIRAYLKMPTAARFKPFRSVRSCIVNMDTDYQL
jgi:hypothetical protein